MQNLEAFPYLNKTDLKVLKNNKTVSSPITKQINKLLNQ